MQARCSLSASSVVLYRFHGIVFSAPSAVLVNFVFSLPILSMGAGV